MKNQLLVTDDPVELKKKLLEAKELKKLTKSCVESKDAQHNEESSYKELFNV